MRQQGSVATLVKLFHFGDLPEGNGHFPEAFLIGHLGDQARSKRSRFITLFHTATKSCRNFSWESSHP